MNKTEFPPMTRSISLFAPKKKTLPLVRVYKDDIGIAIYGLDEKGPELQFFSSSRYLDALQKISLKDLVSLPWLPLFKVINTLTM